MSLELETVITYSAATGALIAGAGVGAYGMWRVIAKGLTDGSAIATGPSLAPVVNGVSNLRQEMQQNLRDHEGRVKGEISAFSNRFEAGRDEIYNRLTSLNDTLSRLERRLDRIEQRLDTVTDSWPRPRRT